jgi:hypothetical protein
MIPFGRSNKGGISEATKKGGRRRFLSQGRDSIRLGLRRGKNSSGGERHLISVHSPGFLILFSLVKAHSIVSSFSHRV